MPLLSANSGDVAARITGTRYGMRDGQRIFRGSVNTSNGGTACIFSSDQQLDLLSATSALTAPYAEVHLLTTNLLLSTIIIRDLRSFEIRFEFESGREFESDVPIRIRFECDVPIRKFRIGCTCRVPSYHKLRSLTVQQKHQLSRRL